MSELITFCINTTKHEKHHVELLFKSLHKHLSRRDHHILVYVENEGEGNIEFLISQKELFPNLKIIRNPLPIPLGYARNINLMFEMATTDIVSYLQSDMVICPNYDLEVLKDLTETNVVSSTRIEPPLHPPSEQTITNHDLGLDPTTFDLEKFSNISNSYKQDKINEFWFAPFTLHKKNWLSIGGHDTLFRRSREDSDMLYRFSIAGIKTIQTWNANVYHFTCTSSRGTEWWTQKNQTRTKLQESSDQVELMRFLRKWPSFKHSSQFNPDKEYKYNISLNLTNASENHAYTVMSQYYRFYRIYIDNKIARDKAIHIYDQTHNPANTLLNISDANWSQYKKYYRTIESTDIFVNDTITSDDVIVDINMNNINFESNATISLLNDIVHANLDSIGTFQCGDLILTINSPVNRIKENVMVNNPTINDIKFEIL